MAWYISYLLSNVGSVGLFNNVVASALQCDTLGCTTSSVNFVSGASKDITFG